MFKQFYLFRNGTLTDTTTLGKSGPGSNGIEKLVHILQSSRTEALPSDCLVSYPGHSLVGSYNSARMQLEYSAVPVDWADQIW